MDVKKERESRRNHFQSELLKTKSKKLKQEINFLTYNLFMRPMVHSVYDDYKDERLKILSKKMGKYDIICFQEIFSLLCFRPSRLMKQAMSNGQKYIRKSPDPQFFSFSLLDGGLMTISRFPIIADEFYRFKTAMESDLLCSKGALYTKIEISENTFIHLFNIHTQAVYDSVENSWVKVSII